MQAIDSFRGKFFFLSNFYMAPVTYGGRTYTNNEAAFQAQKCGNDADRAQFTALDPSSAKRKGRHIALRKDWEAVKTGIMREIVEAKFSQNKDLADKLLATGGAHLIEGNDWGDRVWGQVNGTGENRLGKILMEVRSELRQRAES